jgi:GINS complex subunit 3
METPRIYNNRVRNAIIAGPTSVDTRRIHPYFHRLGIKFVQKFEQEQLAQVLKLASRHRALSTMHTVRPIANLLLLLSPVL